MKPGVYMSPTGDLVLVEAYEKLLPFYGSLAGFKVVEVYGVVGGGGSLCNDILPATASLFFGHWEYLGEL